MMQSLKVEVTVKGQVKACQRVNFLSQTIAKQPPAFKQVSQTPIKLVTWRNKRFKLNTYDSKYVRIPPFLNSLLFFILYKCHINTIILRKAVWQTNEHHQPRTPRGAMPGISPCRNNTGLNQIVSRAQCWSMAGLDARPSCRYLRKLHLRTPNVFLWLSGKALW